MRGIVTIPTTVRMKKGKNCPFEIPLASPLTSASKRYSLPVHRTSNPFHSSFQVYLVFKTKTSTYLLPFRIVCANVLGASIKKERMIS